MTRNKIITSLMGGAVALGLLGSAAVTFAQTPVPSTETPTAVQGDFFGRGHGFMGDQGQALADALGIDLTELQTAQETARIAMIDQAVADGLLTEAQAEQLKLFSFGMGRGGHFGYDRDEYLAEALGITVEELQAAELEAHAATLAAAVEAGVLTQEQADLMLAEKAARSYLDTDALDAQAQAAYEAALAAAVANGAITQAQADALLAQAESAGGFGFGGRGFGGHGFGGHGGRGGHGGFGFMPGLEAVPDTAAPSTTSGSQGA
jgi:hypothetical protein